MSRTLPVTENPYRKFTIVLGVFIFCFTIALAIATTSIINHYVTKDTITFTSEAVHTHLSEITPLRQLFTGSDSNESSVIVAAPEVSGGDGHEHHDASADDPSDSSGNPAKLDSDAGYHWTEESLDQITNIVGMHFSLYHFNTTNFYNRNGISFFSNDHSQINLPVAEPHAEQFRKAWNGEVITYRESGNLLHLWLPVRLDASREITGVVEIVRNISDVDKEIRTIQMVILIPVLAGMLLLFFSLRRIFLSSTRTIDAKNKELNSMLGIIQRTYDESLQALSSALDLRDNETQGHSFRVTSYAYMLGQSLGLSEEELSNLVRGALLHDVGKIGVPDRILLKPDRLTEEEWGVMRSHVEIGYNMLKHIDFLKPSLDVVLHHHERWDGGGYPQQLKGNTIPLSACIFSLCDTYDAITSDRPYRKGRGYQEARAEIERNRGTQFHPLVVDAFLRIPEQEWVSVREEVMSSGECSLKLGAKETLHFRNAAVS